MTDADDRVSSFTSVLKDIAQKIIPTTLEEPKPWFNDNCKDVTKKDNRALERMKPKTTEDNTNAYRIAKAKARRDILHSKETIWRNYVSKMNSQTSVNCREVTSRREIANALTDNVSHNSSSAFSTDAFFYYIPVQSYYTNTNIKTVQ